MRLNSAAGSVAALARCPRASCSQAGRSRLPTTSLLQHVMRFLLRAGYTGSPNSLIAFSLRISGRTSSRIAIFSKSASQRSGVSSG